MAGISLRNHHSDSFNAALLYASQVHLPQSQLGQDHEDRSGGAGDSDSAASAGASGDGARPSSRRTKSIRDLPPYQPVVPALATHIANPVLMAQLMSDQPHMITVTPVSYRATLSGASGGSASRSTDGGGGGGSKGGGRAGALRQGASAGGEEQSEGVVTRVCMAQGSAITPGMAQRIVTFLSATAARQRAGVQGGAAAQNSLLAAIPTCFPQPQPDGVSARTAWLRLMTGLLRVSLLPARFLERWRASRGLVSDPRQVLRFLPSEMDILQMVDVQFMAREVGGQYV